MKKQVNELSPERAKALLGNNELDEAQLIRLMEQIKAFCKVSYQLYADCNPPDKETEQARTLDAEPPNQFTTNQAA